MNALFVAWRSGEESGWGPVGRLEFVEGLYRYCYVRGAQTLAGFRPFAGMDDLNQIYESDELFPLFANRLLSKSRPEYKAFLSWGGFDARQPPDPIAILSVTEGIRQTDAIELFPCPVPDQSGCFLTKFFLHGIRWGGPTALDRIGQLQSDEPLLLKAEPQNPVDRFAVGVHTQDGMRIGYVPRYFARDVQSLLRDCHPDYISLVVERLNRDAPLQHRVLCRIRACWPQGFEPCSGADYELIPKIDPARCS